MAIITKATDENLNSLRFNNYPDQYVSEKKKRGDAYMKDNMDYFANIAYGQYGKNKETLGRNYDLVNGILHISDFYDEPQVKTFIDTLAHDTELPSDVKHYPIVNPPLYILQGELSNRPDLSRVKAMDATSQSEEIKAKTDLVQQLIIQEARQSILAKHATESGEQLSDEDLNKLTMEEVADQLINYTSHAEKWANRALTSCKVEFNMKELSEEGFRDLFITSSEYFHIYEDNSKTGFGMEVLNPVKVWKILINDKKYTSDNTGTGKGLPAAGIVSVMELSEIMEKLKVTKEEIDHLRENDSEPSHLSVESSFNNRGATGVGSIKYPQGSRLLDLERTILEGQLMEENTDDISSILGLNSNVTAFGNKFVVVQAYWASKQKIANVTFIDEQGQIQSMMVDEDYEEIPNQIDIEWGWITRWMKGDKIGPHVYHVEPLKILDYCPIIGVTLGSKNTKARSFIDLMKPLQTIYNVAWNQIFRLLESEKGIFIEIPLRKTITAKDGDAQDAIELLEDQIRERRTIYTDDSIENTKVPTQNTSVIKVHDATLGPQIKSRIELAMMAKNECWELIGMTRQRLGATSGATETATATQAGLSQSYTQTEILFAQHQYLINQVNQAIIDAAQYVTIQKPTSTISYLSDRGDVAFMQVNGSDISLRDLKVFITSRAEDAQVFKEIRLLGEAILQNGGEPFDVSVLYTANSVREMQEIFSKLKEQRQAIQQQQQQTEQQQLKQQSEQFQAELQHKIETERINMQNDNYERELDRINKKEVAIINSFSKQDDNTKDSNSNGVPDIIEVSRLSNDILQADRQHTTSLLALQQKNQADASKIKLEQDKLQVEREKMKNDLQISKNKSKPPKAKKK